MIDAPHMRDPFVLARPSEKKYYLFGTTGRDVWKGPGTGFDAYVSGDLASWEGPFQVFKPESGFWGTENFWAPEVHERDGAYYMFASFKAPDRKRATQILRADSPLGPYRVHSPEPVTPPEWECLDGTLFVDDEGAPWLVFCHEWVQVVDGEVCARRLSPDLSAAAGDPVLLFKASEAEWPRPPRRRDGSMNPLARVTDGPFLRRMASGDLVMLWSGIGEKGYAMGCAYSSGGLLGPWVQEKAPLIADDGGHGMLFETFDGRLCVTYHSPNASPLERFHYCEVTEVSGRLRLADEA